MALRLVDSFDHYATAEITQKHPSSATSVSGATATISAGNGRNSTASGRLNFNGTSGTIYFAGSVAASGATAIIGVGLKASAVDAVSDRNALISIYDGGTCQCTLRVNSDFTVTVTRGVSTGTVLGTSVLGIGTGAYYYIEFKVLLSTTVGTFEVRANNTVLLTGTGANTAGAATTVWGTYRLGQNSTNSAASGTWDFDDLYVADGSGSINNDFLGPIRVKAVLPDGAGNYSQFTPSAGSNYQNVDDSSTNGDTDYNSESTVGEKDTYTFAAVGFAGTVKGVQTNLMVRSNGAGSETVAPMWRISATDYVGTAVGISTSYLDKMQVYELSPATGIAWTISEIDGAESGIKLVS